MSGRIWLLSAYRADSHGAWADWLVDSHPELDWRRLELPGRHFRWRIRGNPLSWLDALPTDAPDLILATSMVDLATVKGLHPSLSGVPAYYYFHENQFSYPVSDRQVDSVDPQMVQLYGALAADRLLFNSSFNRDSFLDGVQGLLDRLPDHVPDGVQERLAAKSAVYPVPVVPVRAETDRDERLIVWNHRWEYDKAPECFADALVAAAQRGADFRLALLGRRPARTPPPLAHIRDRLGPRVVADGLMDRGEYRRWLSRAGIVVSTARHEFQGLAMLEAASAGARPLVPDALCYREQYPAAYRYRPGDPQALADRLVSWLRDGLPATVDVSCWYDPKLLEAWRRLLNGGRTAGGGRTREGGNRKR